MLVAGGQTLGAADDASKASRSQEAEARPVTIFAAASTSDVIQALADQFRAERRIAVSASFGSSAVLAQQIAQGAPAELFLSASPDWGRYLEERGEVAARVDLLANRLVLVVPAGNPAGLASVADLALAKVRRIALGDPAHVPAGKYARQALERLHLWEPIHSRVVAADDVRGALAFVTRGEVDAGIVYATDAVGVPNVRVVATIDPVLHDPIKYPLVLTRNGEHNPDARGFYGFLQSATAAARFQQAGFTVLTSSGRERTAALAPAPVPASPSVSGEWQAIALSLWISACAVALSLPPGLALGYWLARTQTRGKAAVETLVNLPLVVPPVVTGYLLLVLLGSRGWLGGLLQRHLGLEIAFTWKAAAIASAVVSFPLMVRAIRLAFQGVDPRLEQAARTLGAGPMGAFWTVSVPLAYHGIIGGSVLAFARSLGEFGATIMFAGNVEGQTRTIPLAIYTWIHQPGGVEQSWRLVAVSVAIAGLALLASEFLERRGMRRE
jgi:molybdate transport system permease protein